MTWRPPPPAGVPAGVDDAVGACTPGVSELQDDVQEFLTFMTFLGPPTRDFSDQISVTRGEPIFNRIGCAGCHTPRAFVTPNPAPNGVPGGYTFHPYSDFLVHDMGALGDLIGGAGDNPRGRPADPHRAAVGRPVPQLLPARRTRPQHRRCDPRPRWPGRGSRGGVQGTVGRQSPQRRAVRPLAVASRRHRRGIRIRRHWFDSEIE